VPWFSGSVATLLQRSRTFNLELLGARQAVDVWSVEAWKSRLWSRRL
jgi:hypothetical protein